MLNVKRMKDVQLEEVRRLIVVDTRQRSRIGGFSQLLDRPEVEVHIYDHHPPSGDDFSGDLEVVEQRGANTTIMTRLLRQRGLEPSPEEATVMLLGIYEDTGSFTFPSTTPQDLEAASYLLALGADLKVVTEIMSREMTSEQVMFLNQMLENAERYNIHGLDILVTVASSEEYLQDAAFLVHKLRAMEMPDGLFALLRMGDRILLVARSKVDELDVSKVAMEFGGGGHPTAASATIKDMTLHEAKDKLLGLLPRIIKPKLVAKDMMTTPLKTISPVTTIKEAHQIMQRYGLGILPVTADGKFLGLVTWEDVEKGVLHGLGSRAVGDFMRRDVPKVNPDAPLFEVYEHIVSGNQRLLPVVRDGKLLGGITKSDLLRALYTMTPPLEPRGSGSKRRNVKALLEERLPGELLELLREMGKTADEMEMKAYLVGGFVRDLFLGRENLDLDVVIEGDGISFAEAMGEKLGVTPKVHKPMGTAILSFGDRFRIDVATARLEYYPQPASPPRVERSSLKMDLYRRDFTINTLAIDLNPSSFGELIDFFGGQRDLKEKVIRVLHGLSFVEDPSRIFRALRFESRFGFKLGRQTESLMKAAISSGFVDRLSGHRLFLELRLILKEEDPLKVLIRMEDFGLLKVFHPKLSLAPRIRKLLSRTAEVLNWYRLLFLPEEVDQSTVYLLSLTEELGEAERAELLERLRIQGTLRKRLTDERREAQKALWRLRPQMDRWAVFELLEPFCLEILLYLMVLCEGKERQRLLADFISRSRHLRPELKGRDLQALGIPPGPHYQQILRRLLQARVRGEVEGREGEIELVKREFMAKMAGKE
ncbi:MAG: polya polymerase [Deltaproteobacteria bacterium]|nr:MAG: polya polymerase [Deltaproteobacteria bacterium]